MKTIDRNEAVRLLSSTKGKFFGVKFTKKDGSERIMNCKKLVKKAIKGSGKQHPNNIIPVYSNNDRSYRSFDINRLIELRINNVVYRIEEE